jgi:steroid delta-isomerase
MNVPGTGPKEYIAALEAMRPDTIDAVVALCADDVRFTDPFNDVTGKTAYRHVFEDMFTKVSDLTFAVDECHGAGRQWMLRWSYAARLGVLGHTTIEGASYVELGEDGLVVRHADYWDAGRVYERIPVLGAAIGWLRRRISAAG